MEILRIITRKDDNKRNSDAEDVMKLFELLDEQKYEDTTFVAANLKRILVNKPRSVDLCFMLVSINEMKKQIDDLCGIKMIITKLQDSMKNLKNGNMLH